MELEVLLCTTFLCNDGAPILLGLNQKLVVQYGLGDAGWIHVVNEHVITIANTGLAAQRITGQGVGAILRQAVLMDGKLCYLLVR